MRIAFVTTEFPTEYRNGGGLGNYLRRIARLLADAGEVPEVFVLSKVNERIVSDGVLVHRVNSYLHSRSFRAAGRLASFLPRGRYAVETSLPYVATAKALGDALARREREAPFDLVQSADYEASGLFVRRSRRRPHVVRCSWTADLWSQCDGEAGQRKWPNRLERLALRRADFAYAPSSLVATHYGKTFGIRVGVIRPPFAMEIEAAQQLGFELPGRFFIHFGQLRARKGTNTLAEALVEVWRRQPDFHMVWAGSANPVDQGAWLEKWGSHRDKVLWLGALEKPHLYAVLARAEAAVLPSLVDNIPNTVVESLLLNKPVIGTFDSSIDEIVTDGENGVLVKKGDAAALADAMVRVWRGAYSWRLPLIAKSPIHREMVPGTAVSNLLRLANWNNLKAARRLKLPGLQARN